MIPYKNINMIWNFRSRIFIYLFLQFFPFIILCMIRSCMTYSLTSTLFIIQTLYIHLFIYFVYFLVMSMFIQQTDCPFLGVLIFRSFFLFFCPRNFSHTHPSIHPSVHFSHFLILFYSCFFIRVLLFNFFINYYVSSIFSFLFFSLINNLFS